MTDELKPCPNPWCDKPDKLSVVWDLYSRRVTCRCGVKGPKSKTKVNTRANSATTTEQESRANAEAITAWNTRADLVADAVAKERERCAKIAEAHWLNLSPAHTEDEQAACSGGVDDAVIEIAAAIREGK